MYTILKLIENVKRFCVINIKKTYWKMKYGKRIKFGKNIRFRKRFQINMTRDAELIIGDGTSFNNDCSINCHKLIKIGKDNMFGEGVKIYDHNHIFNNKSVNKKYSYNERKIEIGDDNWFGSNNIILSKAKIGNHNVFAAGTIINEIIESDLIIRNDNKIIVENINYKDD